MIYAVMDGIRSLFFIAIFLFMVFQVAGHARKRGYGFWTWFFATLFGTPLFSLVVLASLPDRSHDKRRQALREELQKERANVSAGSSDNSGSAPDSLDIDTTIR